MRADNWLGLGDDSSHGEHERLDKNSRQCIVELWGHGKVRVGSTKTGCTASFQVASPINFGNLTNCYNSASF